jgi:hypothetical protein
MKRKAIAIINRNHVLIRLPPSPRRMGFRKRQGLMLPIRKFIAALFALVPNGEPPGHTCVAVVGASERVSEGRFAGQKKRTRIGPHLGCGKASDFSRGNRLRQEV